MNTNITTLKEAELDSVQGGFIATMLILSLAATEFCCITGTLIFALTDPAYIANKKS